jgi:HD-like signal output (HDOD) protein/GGDEF domain-containing protein
LVQKARQLYSLPAVALRVVELAREPAVDTRTLKACIENDPALAAKIMRVVNSSLFGLNRQVADLNQAVGILGTRPLMTLALGFSLPRELQSGLQADTLACYWRHTLVKAVACRELCAQVYRTEGNEAFIAGLLQDIGMLVLMQELGESYLTFFHQARTIGGSLLAYELEWLGFDHTLLSSKLLDFWGLPPHLAAAVAVPADDEQIAALPDTQRMLPQVLHLAELFVRLIENPHGSALHTILAVGEKYCSLTFPQVQGLFESLQKQVAELAQILSLELPHDQSFVDLLLSAHEQLGVASAETLGSCAANACAANACAIGSGEACSDEPALVEDEMLQQARELRSLAQTQFIAREPRKTTPPSAVANRERIAQPADPGLLGSLATAIAASRLARRSISLTLLEIDDYPQVVFAHGQAAAARLLAMFHTVLANWTHEQGKVIRIDDARFALIWQDCQRSDAVARVRHLLAAVKQWQLASGERGVSFGISAGLATLALPPKNYPAQQLLSAAHRCLSGARLSGGDTFKSIEF